MKTVINIKADKEIKEEAQKLAAELGLPLSAIINAYLREFIRNRAVHFSAVPRMSKELETLLRGVEQDIKNKHNLSKPFDNAEDIAAYLDS